MDVSRGAPLAPHTTLGVGGRADVLVRTESAAELPAALEVAAAEGGPVTLLGSGSNVVVSDQGLRGTTVLLRGGGIRDVRSERDGSTLVRIDGGMDWDAFVAWAVAHDLGGVELLSGIPGTVGAAPVQNIAAYGQSLDETLVGVVAVERTTGRVVSLGAAECGLAYRDSRFKGDWLDRFAITEVTLRLAPSTRTGISYRDLELYFAERGDVTSLGDRREAVLAVRRAKSMVRDAGDPLSRSAGSFFISPRLPREDATVLVERVRGPGAAEKLFSWYAGPGTGEVKVPAALVLLAAGFSNGDRWGDVGLSPRHVLAIVNHGGATAQEISDVAAHIRATVAVETGVELECEPRFLGSFRPFDADSFASVRYVAGSTGTPSWAR